VCMERRLVEGLPICSSSLLFMATKLLDQIKGPADVKKIPLEELPQLAKEIREELIAVLSKTGGHLGPNLGVVELTIALHRVFDTPTDHFIFDVSHQAYVHKLLTGRRDRFHTIRQQGGLNGFMLGRRAITTVSGRVTQERLFRRRWAWHRPEICGEAKSMWFVWQEMPLLPAG